MLALIFYSWHIKTNANQRQNGCEACSKLLKSANQDPAERAQTGKGVCCQLPPPLIGLEFWVCHLILLASVYLLQK